MIRFETGQNLNFKYSRFAPRWQGVRHVWPEQVAVSEEFSNFFPGNSRSFPREFPAPGCSLSVVPTVWHTSAIPDRFSPCNSFGRGGDWQISREDGERTLSQGGGLICQPGRLIACLQRAWRPFSKPLRRIVRTRRTQPQKESIPRGSGISLVRMSHVAPISRIARKLRALYGNSRWGVCTGIPGC